MKPEMQKAVAVDKEDDLQTQNLNLRYVYFGRNLGNNKHSGVTCVGYQVSDDGKSMLVGVAFCSPEDIFSKKKARTIITGRITKGLNAAEQGNNPTDTGYEVIKSDIILFTDMNYEDIINVIRKKLNDRVSADVAGQLNSGKLTAANRPRFASVCMPFWFEAV